MLIFARVLSLSSNNKYSVLLAQADYRLTSCLMSVSFDNFVRCTCGTAKLGRSNCIVGGCTSSPDENQGFLVQEDSMKIEKLKRHRRLRRQHHIRRKLIGTAERPRLNVFRSLKHIYCQIVDDTHIDKHGHRCGTTLVACSTVTPSIHEQVGYGGNIKAASKIGEEIAKLAKEKGITKVAFDRGGYKYHGRVKALAEAARKGGLEF